MAVVHRGLNRLDRLISVQRYLLYVCSTIYVLYSVVYKGLTLPGSDGLKLVKLNLYPWYEGVKVELWAVWGYKYEQHDL